MSVFEETIRRALGNQAYRFSGTDISTDVVSGAENFNASTEAVWTVAAPLLNAVGGDRLPHRVPKLHPARPSEKLEEALVELRQIGMIAAFKYFMVQLDIVLVVDADAMTSAEVVAAAARFDAVVGGMKGLTGTMGGFKLGSRLIGSTSLSVTGVIVFVFHDPDRAAHFHNKTQSKCKIFHFLKKTWVVPWFIDVANERVVSHSSLPILAPQIIDRVALEADLF